MQGGGRWRPTPRNDDVCVNGILGRANVNFLVSFNWDRAGLDSFLGFAAGIVAEATKQLP